ncbi:hypothetical protein EES46_10770 [Streptomyces sp. ADI98-10]|nr:hypothetical protein EES46_10770 [Streptomyces sp. ADI98-10]
MPAPLVPVVAVGLVAGCLPGVPTYHLDAHVVLPPLLPPLLHTAALDSSYRDLRADVRPVTLLSVGYTLFATVAVGRFADRIIPDLPPPLSGRLAGAPSQRRVGALRRRRPGHRGVG